MRVLRLSVAMCLAVMVALGGISSAFAIDPDEKLADPALETRARSLSAELRCLVCQNQSIDDSDAALAKDLRVIVRERLVAGDTDKQVLDYVVSRYGEFVLLRPPFNSRTLLLWLAPALLLLGTIAYVVMRIRQPSPDVVAAETPAPLSEAEKRRLAELTETGKGDA
jgi:cytochrome c-type biogenesis protein CcmH